MKLCITGANSSVGRNLLQHLARRDDMSAVALVRSNAALAALPQAATITPIALDYADAAAMRAACGGADAIVHLAGVLFESKRASYQSANVESSKAVLNAARAAGVPQVLFISVLGADAASANPFYRSKGQAERLFLESGLAATVLRTPLLLGPHSAGGRALLREARSGKAKLLGGGRHVVRPLDLDDLSAAILAGCAAPKGARVLELCGPQAVPYHALVTQLAALEGNKVEIASISLWLAKLLSGISHAVKGGGMSPAIIDVITASEDPRENADAALGLSLTPLTQTLTKLKQRK
ncbi:MAG: NAD(P)H-binding protein [Pseudomonadales bacterium]|jgi:NADH dehydrogenase|nr:NAD(P)H-binding protein [Pseudomonadales bacterium]